MESAKGLKDRLLAGFYKDERRVQTPAEREEQVRAADEARIDFADADEIIL